MLAITEHRVNEQYASQIIKKITGRWRWCDNYNTCTRERIWLIWDLDLMNFTLIEAHTQFIHGLSNIYALNMQITITAVYGLHTINDRRGLWNELGNMVHTVQGPWIALGDFNSIIDTDDKIGGAPIQDVETREFRKFLLDSGLVELKSVGRRYTWTNSHMLSKIGPLSTQIGCKVYYT